jgi:septal ring factor EnvC (AmiA/AmiB activator)
MPHAMLFNGKFGKPFARPVLVPAATDEKPYVVVSDADLAQLMEEPTFKSAYEQDKLKILPSIPAQFQDLATTLVKTRSENGELKAKVLALETANAELSAKVSELTGIIEQQLNDQSEALSPEELVALSAHIGQTPPLFGTDIETLKAKLAATKAGA